MNTGQDRFTEQTHQPLLHLVLLVLSTLCVDSTTQEDKVGSFLIQFYFIELHFSLVL
jgi:hypothetical protein